MKHEPCQDLFSLSSHIKHTHVQNLDAPKYIENKTLSAVYTDDYNILDLDQIIQRQYKEKKEIYQTYVTENAHLLQEYRSLCQNSKIISFGCKIQKNESLTAQQIERRFIVIEEYLENAKKYINIDIRRDYPKTNTCDNCGGSLNDVYIDDNGLQCCPECGLENVIYTNYSNTSSKSVTVKNDYEDRKNFWMALMKYQCKQLIKFPKKLIADLDQYFLTEGLPTGSQVKSMPLNDKGTRGKTSRTMLLTALSATGYPEYYVDCSLIGHIYFDWKAPDVSELEDLIMSYYDRTQRVFNNMNFIDRSSSINIQYRLFKHLQQCGHPCTIDDFKIVKTPEILENLERIWKFMCEYCDLPYIPTI